METTLSDKVETPKVQAPVTTPADDSITETPKMYRVILHNDHTTLPSFVVDVLNECFSIEQAKAERIMMHAHTSGSATVKVTTRDIAESQLSKAEAMIASSPPGSHANHVPACELKFSIEPEA